MRILSTSIIYVSLLAGSLVSGQITAAMAAEASTRGPSTGSVHQKKDEVDKLFASLAKAASPVEAKTIEQQIISAWNQSGSATVDLFMAWANIAMNGQNLPRALDLVDQAIVLKPDYAEAYNRRATVYFMMGDFRHSIADIQTTLAFEPRHFGALSGLGMILLDIGDKKRAEDIFRRLLKINPQETNAQEALDKLVEENKGREL